MRTHLTALKLLGWIILCLLGSTLAAGAALGLLLLIAYIHEATPEWSHWTAGGVAILAGIYWLCWELAREQELLEVGNTTVDPL